MTSPEEEVVIVGGTVFSFSWPLLLSLQPGQHLPSCIYDIDRVMGQGSVFTWFHTICVLLKINKSRFKLVKWKKDLLQTNLVPKATWYYVCVAVHTHSFTNRFLKPGCLIVIKCMENACLILQILCGAKVPTLVTLSLQLQPLRRRWRCLVQLIECLTKTTTFGLLLVNYG